MAFLIGGANTESAAYEISNSLRFNDDDNPSLSKANSSGGSNTAGTLSFWTKRSEIDTGYLFYARSDNSNVFNVYFSGNERLEIRSTQGGSAQMSYKTNALFRDPSAWYHIVIAIDTTDGTAADRCKLFVNGSRVTSFETQTNFGSSNTIEFFQSDATLYVTGEFEGGTIANPYDGYIAEMYLIDGSQKAATDFGKTDDNGVWIPEKYTGSYGTNGFKLEFKQTGTSANSSGIGADTSGNDRHFSVSNLAALDVTVDTPTNNFATFNPLDNYYQQYTYAEGNLKITTNADYYNWNTSTIGVTSGKWYVEGKATQVGTGSDNWVFGIAAHSPSSNNQGIGADNFSIGYRNNGNYKTGDSNSTHGASFSEGDIVMIALDLDNDNVYFGSGGQWADGSGNTDEASPNSAVSLSNLRGSTTLGDTVFFAFGDWNSNASSTVGIGEFNFGNPVHSISSGNADGNGYGNFEYAVPSGYYALCTKNLAEYG